MKRTELIDLNQEAVVYQLGEGAYAFHEALAAYTKASLTSRRYPKKARDAYMKAWKDMEKAYERLKKLRTP